MKKLREIEDLRDHLFNQLEKLSKDDCDLEKEIKRSQAMINVGNVIISSAKAEFDVMRLTGTLGTGFIPVSAPIPVNGNSQKRISNGK